MPKARAAVAATILTLAALLATAVPAAAAVHRPGCPQYRACFYTGLGDTSAYAPYPGPKGQWNVIPAAYRLSTSDAYTHAVLWLYARTGPAAGTYQCLPQGTHAVNGHLRGHWYAATTGTCQSTPPAPPA